MFNADGIAPHTRFLMTAALECAVPIWIEKLRDQPVEHLLERARVCGEHIAARGDVLQFKNEKAGASAEAFDRLAEGLAALALVADGGVTFLGVRWEAKRPLPFPGAPPT